MDRVIHLVSRSSNEIYDLRYPDCLLNFCDYDLTFFAEKAIALCNDALRTGELDFERSTKLRNTLSDAHVYIERHLRTVYDKIVIDCWLDYICRRDNIGTGAVWNRFLPCKTSFEKAVFKRLCDFRFNKAINEWLNLVRVQDYAKSKVGFIFSKNPDGAEEAAARRNYFDLMFSVTASELGCRLEDMGVTKVFSAGRLPSAPFMYPNISKGIIKSALAEYDYSEDFSKRGDYGELSDQIAMDAFSYMKHIVSSEMNSLNITAAQTDDPIEPLYMPSGLKAVVDLEIDVMLQRGCWISRCRRCGRYFVRDAEHPEEYCSLSIPDGGKTCLEIYELEHPRAHSAVSLEKKCRKIDEIMTARINVSMTRSEYEDWKNYLDSLREKVESGELPESELDNFISYSDGLDLSKSKPVSEVAKRSAYRSDERVVKPFIPERVDRSEITAPKKKPSDSQRAEPIQWQSIERTTPPRVIRAGDRLDGESVIPNAVTPPRSPVPAQAVSKETPTAPASVLAQGAQKPAPQVKPTQPTAGVKPPAAEQRAAEKQPAAADEQVEVASVIREAEHKEAVLYNGAFAAFGEPQVEELTEQQQKEIAAAELVTGNPETPPPPQPKVIRKNAAAMSAYGRMSGTPMVTAGPDRVKIYGDEPNKFVSEIPEQTAPDKAAPDQTTPEQPSPSQAKPAQPASGLGVNLDDLDPDPFKDVGSIFDNLVGETQKPALVQQGAVDEAPEEDAPPEDIVRELQQRNREKRRSKQRPSGTQGGAQGGEPAQGRPHRDKNARILPSNPPRGIWAEPRGLFPDDDDDDDDYEEESELEMLKEGKRHRTNKTQRLFDAIMREPEDNPNVRRKDS